MLTSPPPLLTLALCALAMVGGGAILATPTPGDLAGYFSPEGFSKGASCPGELGDGMPAVDDFRAEWYAKVWRAADEPSLYLRTRDGKASTLRTYRFTLLRSFHGDVVVRLDERSDGRFLMTATSLASPDLHAPGRFRPGQRADKISRLLTPNESRATLGLIENSKLMSAAPIVCDQGLDGSQWIFEGIEGGKLHYVDRWSPDTGPARDIGLAFLSLTGWDLDPIY